jgi:hypothetical protein
MVRGMVRDSSCHSTGNMKLASVVMGTVTVLSLTGCAAYSVSNAVTWITTGKSITDHGTSTVTRTDCDSVRAVRELTYYCESTPDIDIRYNRNGI